MSAKVCLLSGSLLAGRTHLSTAACGAFKAVQSISKQDTCQVMMAPLVFAGLVLVWQLQDGEPVNCCATWSLWFCLSYSRVDLRPISTAEGPELRCEYTQAVGEVCAHFQKSCFIRLSHTERTAGWEGNKMTQRGHTSSICVATGHCTAFGKLTPWSTVGRTRVPKHHGGHLKK